MDSKAERLRSIKEENRKAAIAEAAAIITKAYPDLAPAMVAAQAVAPDGITPAFPEDAARFEVYDSGDVVYTVGITESILVTLSAETPRAYRQESDYAVHIKGGSKSGTPIVAAFEDGGLLRVVEWDGGRTACVFSYDAKTGRRQPSCKMSYKVGHTSKGAFIAPYDRRHYLLPVPPATEEEADG